MSQKRCTQRVSAEGACSDTPVGSKANVHVHVPGPEGAGEVARGTDNVCRLQEERWKGNGTGERSTLTCMAGVAALLIRCFETGLLTRISALEKSAHSCYFTRLKPPRFLVRFVFLKAGILCKCATLKRAARYCCETAVPRDGKDQRRGSTRPNSRRQEGGRTRRTHLRGTLAWMSRAPSAPRVSNADRGAKGRL